MVTVASMVGADFAVTVGMVAVVTEVAATAVVTADVTNEFGYQKRAQETAGGYSCQPFSFFQAGDLTS